MNSSTGLNAGFFIGRKHEFIVFQRDVLPHSFVMVKYSGCLKLKLWVSRKNPASMLLWPNCILMKPTPNGAATDRRYKSRSLSMQGKVKSTEARKGQTPCRWEFTSQSLNLHDQFWGEKPGADRDDIHHQGLPIVFQKSACATLKRFREECQVELQFHHFQCLVRQEESFLIELQKNTITYISMPFWPVPFFRLMIDQS